MTSLWYWNSLLANFLIVWKLFPEILLLNLNLTVLFRLFAGKKGYLLSFFYLRILVFDQNLALGSTPSFRSTNGPEEKDNILVSNLGFTLNSNYIFVCLKAFPNWKSDFCHCTTKKSQYKKVTFKFAIPSLDDSTFLCFSLSSLIVNPWILQNTFWSFRILSSFSAIL